jgi:hypothetical protein
MVTASRYLTTYTWGSLRPLDGQHPQLIAPILPRPQGRGRTGVAQLFPEGAPLVVVQVGVCPEYVFMPCMA